MRWFVHANNKDKDILILGKGKKQGLDNNTLRAETEYSIYFSRLQRKIFLSLRSNERNSFLFVNATKIYYFKLKDSEIKAYPLCLGKISKGFSVDNMKTWIWLNEYIYDFSVDYNAITVGNILDIHKYLMKKHDTK